MPPQKNKPVKSPKDRAAEYSRKVDLWGAKADSLAADNKFRCGGKSCSTSSSGRILDESTRIHPIENLGAETDAKYCKQCTKNGEHLD